jgi:sorbitol-specific phosphotransferase system component IIA
MAISEDLNVFLVDFGIIATHQSSDFLVIFDEFHSPMELGAEGRSIVATAQTSDTENFHHGDTLTVNQQDYIIVGIRPIDDGKFTELDLKYG